MDDAQVLRRSAVGFSQQEGIEFYTTMRRIRVFEEGVKRLYSDGEIPGFVHLSIGQEASATGACSALRDSDLIASTHRGHGHCLAKGMSMYAMMAELMGRDEGSNRGLGGSMHIADPRVGILGANGIVAGGLPIAVGAALGSRLAGEHQRVVAFFGDGALNQGAFHEAANLSAVWNLPIIFFCENNGYAEFSPFDAQHPVDIETRAIGYGMDFRKVDGSDVFAVVAVMREALGVLDAGNGPMLVEATVDRYEGHYVGDPQRYRQPASAETSERDPLARCRAWLIESGVSDEVIQGIDETVDNELRSAITQARAAPEAKTQTVVRAGFVPSPGGVTRPNDDGFGDDEGPIRYMDAIRAALFAEMASDPTVFIAGVDVGAGGNVFGITRGLHDRWPNRVLDTPISEAGIVGAGVGASILGLRPVVELMYLDFLGVCFDQILNQAAKLRFMTGGRLTVPLTVRTQFGAGRSSGSQHSQSLEALVAHIPGLKVVMPSSPADTYLLLRSAIRDPNPVVFIENRNLYGKKGRRPLPDDDNSLGKAKVVRSGSDATIVSWSRMLHDCIDVADQLAEELGADVEVIDLRTIVPLDFETIAESVARTGRLLVAHEAVKDFGVGAEIAARIAADSFWMLDAPVYRVGAHAHPAPYAPNLEREWLPSRTKIANAVTLLLQE